MEKGVDVLNTDKVDEAYLERLVDNQATETWTLDFKLDMERDSNQLPSKDSKKEFLADITALANTFGGQLIYGIREEDGKAKSVDGIDVLDIDKFESLLNNLVRDCVEPKLIGIDFNWVQLESGKQVLVVSAAKSWNSPHVVHYGKHWRFYRRHSNGKHPMDIVELKESFDSLGNSRLRAKQYRDERYEEITRRSHFIGGPIPEELKSNPAIIQHIIPGMHGLGVIQTELGEIESLLSADTDVLRIFNDCFLCFDGFCARNSFEDKVDSNLLFSREGVLEVILCDQLVKKCDRRWLSSSFERILVKITRSFLSIYKQLEVPLPFFVFLTLRGFPSYSILNRSYEPHRQLHFRKFRRDPMLSYPVVIQDYECDVPAIMKPLFDPIWNEFGREQSGNYNDKGIWK